MAIGEFEMTVLFAVLRLTDSYGMSIHREIQARTGRSVSIGALYTTLDRLEEKGLVTSAMSEATPERGGRRKRIFEITGEGERQIDEAWSALAKMRRGIVLEGAR